MKKVILFLLLLMPMGVNAMANSETFNVGDDVVVMLTSDTDKKAFRVLKASTAGEEDVLLIYGGIAGNTATLDGPTVYDEEYEGHTPTANLASSYVYTKLLQATAGWRATEIRLLTVNDLNNIGINADGTGKISIPAQYSWLAPIKIDSPLITSPSFYNYWTSSEAVGQTNTSVYYVKYNEERTDSTGVWASLEPADITKITDGVENAIRPVVRVKKEYILCNNSKPTVTNVKTGVSDYFLPLASIILISAVTIVVIRRKSIFVQL